MPIALRKFYTEEEFLTFERMAKVKNEYYRGEIFAMSGASFQHNQLSSKLIRDIGNHLKGKGCNIFGSDLRVYTQLNSFYTYPDAVIICGDPSFIDKQFDTILNPAILFEILSPSTEEYDRTTKFEFYKNIPTLKHYVLIDSRKFFVQIFTQEADKSWSLKEYNLPDEQWLLKSIQYKSTIKELYEGVKFT